MNSNYGHSKSMCGSYLKRVYNATPDLVREMGDEVKNGQMMLILIAKERLSYSSELGNIKFLQ